MNAESEDPQKLSIRELEALLAQKRRRRTAKRARRFLDAEQTVREASSEEGGERTGGTTSSPSSWRGAGGKDRRFHSLQVEPIQEGRSRQGDRLAEGARRVRADGGGILDRARRGGWSLALSVVEIAALAGLLAILGSYYGRLRTQNVATPTTTARMIAVAAATETPTVAPSATPSPKPTRKPTRKEAAAAQKDQSTPSPSREPSLTPASATETPTPLPGPAIPKRLVIPSINVDAPIVQGDDEEKLKQGVGHHDGSANPGERGNVVLSAHNDIYGEIFRDLQRLKPGAKVLVHTDARAFEYVVQGVKIVAPTEVEFMEPTDDARLTMITCHPYLLDTHRVVAVARLAE